MEQPFGSFPITLSALRTQVIPISRRSVADHSLFLVDHQFSELPYFCLKMFSHL